MMQPAELDWLPTPETSLLRAATLYIEHGVRLVLVHGVVDAGDAIRCTCGAGPDLCKPGKHPILGAWQRKVYRTIEEFRDALAHKRIPDAPNLGIVMGEQLNGEHWLAIDADILDRLKHLESVLGELPPTLMSRSGGGGSHRIYKLGAGQDPKRLQNRGGLRLPDEPPTPGVDVKWIGGQVVVSPSLHESGNRYAWVNSLSVSELPAAWYETIADPIPPPKSSRPPTSRRPGDVVNMNHRWIERVVQNNANDIAGRGKGERNQVLFSKSCTVLEHCAGVGISFDYALEQLRIAGIECGLPKSEVNSVLRKAERQVRRSGNTRTPPGLPEATTGTRAIVPALPSPTETTSSNVEDGEVEEEGDEDDDAGVDFGEGKAFRWRAKLITKRGDVDDCLANVITILTEHPSWKGVLQYDMFREAVVFTRPPPCRPQDAPQHRTQGPLWLETDDTRTQAWIRQHIGFEPSRTMVSDAVATVAEGAAMHPVREYLDQLEWDGEERLPTFLSNYFGARVSAYTAGIGMCWMISGVARVMRPGCQVDYMLVLEGAQGLGKSSGVRALLPKREWFSDTGIVIGQKDSYLTLHGLWIYGFDELDSIRGSDITKTKSFLTSPSDRLRPPYGRRMRDFPRQTIFVGTTNETEYLRDRTGNRRFWPVTCTKIDVEAIARDRDQLWAEAKARFERGEKWWPNAELSRLCSEQQSDRTIHDPWTSIVEDWLETDGAKRMYQGTGGLHTHDVLQSALAKPARDITKGDEMRVGEVLRELGWERARETDGERRRLYVRRDGGT